MSPRFSWTQPCCDECWSRRYPNREATRLVEDIRETEMCVYCKNVTRSGIYVRIDPDKARFPTNVK